MDIDDGKPYIWRKKYEEQGIRLTDSELLEIVKRQIEINRVELEKIKERQRKREEEHQQRILDGEFLQRQKEAEQHHHWEQQGDDFDMRQHLLKSKIRIRDNRSKPIDLFAHYIDVFGVGTKDRNPHGMLMLQANDIDLSHFKIELVNPYDRIQDLNLDELDALASEIDVYMKSDNKSNQQFWMDISAITKCQQTLIELDDAQLEKRFNNLLEPLHRSQLEQLEQKMLDVANIDDEIIDEQTYQVGILMARSLKAKRRLTENHKKNLRDYKHKEIKPAIDSKPMLPKNENQDTKPETDEEAFQKAARAGMNEEEEQFFKGESAIVKPSYPWSNRYQPRKPTYINRVHTGFEWNKYNRTHYDIDNPPTKAVQGYKFNIFYPDLVDRTKTPTFTITPCKDDKDFAVIRFKAGPPYEDIAFRIVHKDWNKSPKSGYRCQFNRGVLQLWFMFKRYKYRR